MIITRSEQLSGLLDLVHDRWFNVEHVTLDKERRRVEIYLEQKKKDLTRGSKDAVRMIIGNAVSLTICDTEKVRDYDLNEINYDPGKNCVTVTGGIPIKIEVGVTALRIEI